MSKGATRKPKWLQGQWGDGSAVRWWAERNTPHLTRSYWPVWRLPFPTLPTLSGKRRASRAERARSRKEARSAALSRWARATTAHTMAAYARIMAGGEE